ncbi:MAG: flagellar FliJ family protein [Rhodobacterales bacterium]|nr:flagellar FliJ family protein [Rhodobacterales bacterium]
MAKDLGSLIRLHEWRVDEKRRMLGDLLRLLDELNGQVAQLEADLMAEQSLARGAPAEVTFTLGAYTQAAIARKRRLNESIIQAEALIEGAREELRVAYHELRRYELAQENRDAQARADDDRRERIELDDLGIQTHVRKVS